MQRLVELAKPDVVMVTGDVWSENPGGKGDGWLRYAIARFEELENTILYSKIAPKNNILTFLMVHFADRFPMEDFLLFDAGRYLFGVHPAGRPWYTLQGKDAWERVQSETEKLSTAELHYRELFRSFCHTIAIKERENRELQRNMLPLRFQEYMVEFQ
jgi:probable DNA metabolism protein